MRLLWTKKIEGCIDGDNVMDVLYDKPVTKEFVCYLGKLGKLIYNDDLEKPFYRVIVRGKYTLKGSQGNKTTRVMLPDNVDDSWLNEISEYTEQYEEPTE